MRLIFLSIICLTSDLCFQEDMRSYDMECITMRKRANQFLSMEVPGLAERRPSLVHGDYIFAKLASEKDDPTIPAYQVHYCYSRYDIVTMCSPII